MARHFQITWWNTWHGYMVFQSQCKYALVNVAMGISTLDLIIGNVWMHYEKLGARNAYVRNDGFIPFNMNNSWKWWNF